MTKETKHGRRRPGDHKLAAMASLGCFEGCSAATLRRLGSLFDWVEVAPGTMLAPTRPRSAWLAVVLDGEMVSIEHGMPVIVRRGDCVGHEAFFDATVSSSPAVALTSLTMLIIGRAAFVGVTQAAPSVAVALGRTPDRVRLDQVDRSGVENALVRLALAS